MVLLYATAMFIGKQLTPVSMYVKVPVLALVYATVTFSVNPHATATFIGNLRDGHNIKVPASLRLSQYLCVVSLVRTTSPLLPTPMKV